MIAGDLRLIRWLGCAFGVAATLAPARELRAGERVVLFVDRDDDDADGVPDNEQSRVPRAPELHPVARPASGSGNVAVRGDAARVLLDGAPVASGAAVPPGAARIEIQAVRAGRAEVSVLGRSIDIGAVAVHAVDGAGLDVDLTRSHASMQRTPPDRLGDDPRADAGDPDAVRFVVHGFADDLPSTLTLVSLSTEGAPIDSLPDMALAEVPCPRFVTRAPGLICASTWPVRAAADDIDRSHPLVAERSIKVELGGAIAVASAQMEKLQMLRVAGPRRTPAGPIGRHRAALRMFLLRAAPGGAPPVGGNDAGAIEIARGDIERANAMWGACGFTFGPPRQAEVRVVDPPRAHLLALGCDHGLPASGGVVRVRVNGREVTVKLVPRMRPAEAARAVAAAIARAGFEARVSDNAAMGAGAFGTSDVLVRDRAGKLATIEPPARGPITSDATLTACIGRVDLEDGLAHFGDVDAVAGTVEERALIKAFDDGDPSTIEVFVVPSFTGGGRIGESFIAADGGALRNILVIDRAGIRADRASFALAHELGHILLDDPGHPDDFGVDTPTRLMDADATNPSAFGPRRLTFEECARALRQSGPGAPVTVLRRWPLTPLGK